MHKDVKNEKYEEFAIFFEEMRQLTITGYYTSKVGMTIERSYLPTPGHYDGAYPYEKVGTLFTSWKYRLLYNINSMRLLILVIVLIAKWNVRLVTE